MKYDVECPASDWPAIQKILGLTSHSIPENEQSFFGLATPSKVEVTGRSSLRQLNFVSELITAGSKTLFGTVVSSSQQVAVADALTTSAILWDIAMSNTSSKGHGSVLNQLDAVHSITEGYYQPYTSVCCGYDVISGPTDNDPVAFPAYPGVGVRVENALESKSFEHSVTYQNLTKSDIFSTAGTPGEYRLRWVELPFNGTAIGAIILMPRSPQNTTQELMTCSIGAGWGLSIMNTSTMDAAAAPVLSQIDAKNSTFSLASPKYSGTGIPGTSPAEMLTIFRSAFVDFPTFPQRPITVTEGWARYLNPSIAYLNKTIFDSLMRQKLFLSPAETNAQAELILAGMVANGLSRIGSSSQLQGTVKRLTESDGSIDLDGNYWYAGKGNNVFQVDPVESKDWVRFRVSSTVEEYSYNTYGTTTKLAMGFLLAYCLVALIHIIYAGISGISSTCWDSIGEVTALAMNSTPTAALRNTCAGISELNIFKLPVRVLAFRDAEGDGEHLELVFGTLDEKTVENKVIKADRAYGTMPNSKAHEKIARE